MDKSVSVIIVTYNSEKHIFDCLDALYANNDIGDALEVVIVDNQSVSFAETQQLLKSKYGDGLVIIQNDRNGGYGQGNNVGIRKASAPIIMIMNPDVRLIEPVFKKAIEAFKDQRVVQFGMQQLDKNGNRAYSFAVSSWIHPCIGLPLTSICNKLKWYFPKIMYLCGACFFIRKSSFEEVGLFDERLFMYFEEDDIHYRLMKGKKNTIVYDKSLGYLHLHGLYSEHKEDDYIYEKTSLKNDILINGERGRTKNAVLKREIIWYKMFLIKEKISYMVRKDSNTKAYIKHLQGWIKQLEQMR